MPFNIDKYAPEKEIEKDKTNQNSYILNQFLEIISIKFTNKAEAQKANKRF